MKIRMLFLTGVIAFFSSCDKDPKEVDLPFEVDMGKSIVYLNGKEVDYEPHIFLHKVYNHMNFPFVQKKGDILNQVAFSWLPVKTGDFALHTERVQYVKALTSFSQIVDEDIEGYEYELESPDEGFFNIEGLDTVKLEVKGRFKAKFRRTSKNGHGNLGLPEVLLFQGIFNEKYEKR